MVGVASHSVISFSSRFIFRLNNCHLSICVCDLSSLKTLQRAVMMEFFHVLQGISVIVDSLNMLTVYMCVCVCVLSFYDMV